MQANQQVNKKISHPVMRNIKEVLAHAPRKHVGFNSVETSDLTPSGLPALKRMTAVELHQLLLTVAQLDRITTQQTMLNQILSLIKSINEIAVLAELGLDPLVLPEIGQRLMHLDKVVAQADYANAKLGRGAVIAKARAEQDKRAAEQAAADAMSDEVTKLHGKERADEIMKNRKVA